MRHYATGRKRPGMMNKTEAAYARVLEGLRIGNKIEWYAYEGIKLRLADNTFYTPDFFVMNADGELECHEVKGTTRRKNKDGHVVGSKPFVMEDAAIKIKCAAEKFPFRFVIAYYTRSGWESEEV